MNETAYPFGQTRAEFRYEFTSISKQKEVRKVVLFSAGEDDQFYNLALLDILPDGSTSDITETKNQDMKTVLATVIQIVIHFLEKRPDAFILFQGSDQRRQRLYQTLINREYDRIKDTFVVRGVIDEIVEFFEPNRPYEFFIINRKYQNNEI